MSCVTGIQYDVVEQCGLLVPPSKSLRLVSPERVAVNGTYTRPWELYDMLPHVFTGWLVGLGLDIETPAADTSHSGQCALPSPVLH